MLCRYYDKNSEYYDSLNPKPNKILFDAKKVLEDFISTRVSKAQRPMFFERMYTMLGRFQRKTRDTDLDPIWLSEPLVEELFEYAIKDLKLAIVAVIDGLDLLSIATMSKKKYFSRLRSLERYLAQETSQKCYNIVFIRPQTKMDLSELKGQTQGISTIHDDENFEYICPVDAEEIFKKRINFMWDVDAKFPLSGSQIRQFTEFVENTISDVTNVDGQPLTWIEVIKSLSGKDARTATQIMSSMATVSYALSDKESYASYAFIEQAMLGRLSLIHI